MWIHFLLPFPVYFSFFRYSVDIQLDKSVVNKDSLRELKGRKKARCEIKKKFEERWVCSASRKGQRALSGQLAGKPQCPMSCRTPAIICCSSAEIKCPGICLKFLITFSTEGLVLISLYECFMLN